MKKIILILTTMFAVSLSYAAQIDSSSLVSKTDETESKAFFKSMVVGAKDTLNTGYEVIVQQQRVYSIEYLIVGVICLIFMYFCIKFYRKATGVDKIANTLLPSLVFGALSLWCGIVFSLHFHQVVQGFLNPDYAAMTDIVTMFKSMKK